MFHYFQPSICKWWTFKGFLQSLRKIIFFTGNLPGVSIFKITSIFSIKSRTCAPTNIIKPAINPTSWCWFFASPIDALASVKILAIKNNIPEKRTNFFCWLFEWPKLIFRVDAHCPMWQPISSIHSQVSSDSRVMWCRYHILYRPIYFTLYMISDDKSQ